MDKTNKDGQAGVTVNQMIGGYPVEMVFRSESTGGTVRAVKEQIQQAYAERISARHDKRKKT